jgi:hypothetical protein
MCFRPAILSLPLLLVFTVAHAQQSSQQNPCFELYRNPSAGVAGALFGFVELIDSIVDSVVDIVESFSISSFDNLFSKSTNQSVSVL